MLNENLRKAIYEHHGGEGAFKIDARDILAYGMETGFSNWTTYSDLVPFFLKHKREIMNELARIADETDKEMSEILHCENGDIVGLMFAETAEEMNTALMDTASRAVWIIVEEAASEVMRSDDCDYDRLS